MAAALLPATIDHEPFEACEWGAYVVAGHEDFYTPTEDSTHLQIVSFSSSFARAPASAPESCNASHHLDCRLEFLPGGTEWGFLPNQIQVDVAGERVRHTDLTARVSATDQRFRFVGDRDPTTVTDPSNADYDGDGWVDNKRIEKQEGHPLFGKVVPYDGRFGPNNVSVYDRPECEDTNRESLRDEHEKSSASFEGASGDWPHALGSGRLGCWCGQTFVTRRDPTLGCSIEVGIETHDLEVVEFRRRVLVGVVEIETVCAGSVGNLPQLVEGNSHWNDPDVLGEVVHESHELLGSLLPDQQEPNRVQREVAHVKQVLGLVRDDVLSSRLLLLTEDHLKEYIRVQEESHAPPLRQSLIACWRATEVYWDLKCERHPAQSSRGFPGAFPTLEPANPAAYCATASRSAGESFSSKLSSSRGIAGIGFPASMTKSGYNLTCRVEMGRPAVGADFTGSVGVLCGIGASATSTVKRDLGAGRFQEQSTDPTARDSDADGLRDGDEAFESVSGAGIGDRDGIPMRGLRADPSVFDTDADQLSDGQEIQGWTINIVFEKTKDRKEERRVSSNPLVPDTDSDTVTDFSEFQNTSDPTKADTDSDAILDKDEEPGGHWQIEGKDPEIVGHITARVQAKFTQVCVAGVCVDVLSAWTLKVNYTVRDNAGLLFTQTNIIGEKVVKTYFGVGVKQSDVFVDHDVSLLSWKAIVSGFDINVTVSDVNGNGVFGDAHADSIAEGVIKALFAAIVAFVKAVGDAVSKMLEWLWSVVTAIITVLTKPIADMVNRFVRQVAELIHFSFADFLVFLMLALFLPVAIIVSAIFTGCKVVYNLFAPAELIVPQEGIAKFLQPFIMFFSATFPLVGRFFDEALFRGDITEEVPFNIAKGLFAYLGLLGLVGGFANLFSKMYRVHIDLNKKLGFGEKGFVFTVIGLLIGLAAALVSPSKEKTLALDLLSLGLVIVGLYFGFKRFRQSEIEAARAIELPEGKSIKFFRLFMAIAGVAAIAILMIGHFVSGQWPI